MRSSLEFPDSKSLIWKLRGRTNLSACLPFSAVCGHSAPLWTDHKREGAAGLAPEGGQITIPKSISVRGTQLEGELLSCCIQSWHQGEGFFPLKFSVTWLLLGENELKSRHFRSISQISHLFFPQLWFPFQQRQKALQKYNSGHSFFTSSFEAGGKLTLQIRPTWGLVQFSNS